MPLVVAILLVFMFATFASALICFVIDKDKQANALMAATLVETVVVIFLGVTRL